MDKPTRTATPGPFIVQPTSRHTHTFILLHGLGNNGENFGSEFLQSGISSSGAKITDVYPGAKFIFPTAQKRRSSAFGRAMITQWFDIASLDDFYKRQDVQYKGLTESARDIRAMLDQELAIVPKKNLVLGGLSQGCAMALVILLSLEYPIGGFIGMSGWLPFCKDLNEVIKSASLVIDSDLRDVFSSEEDDGDGDGNGDHGMALDPSIAAINFARDTLSLDELTSLESTDKETSLSTPVLLCHGKEDEKVKWELGENGAQTLSSIGMQVDWKEYPGLGHWYKIPDEIDDILQFLREKVGWVRL